MAGDAGELRSRLELITTGFEASAKKMEAVMTRFGKTTSKAVGKDTVEATKKARKQISNFVWTATSGIKAVSRVVYGILIAQTFYRLVRVIQDATREVINFSMQLERSAIAFKYLLGGTEELAAGMMRAIEDLAALTPYTYETAENAARTLLALGFMPEQIIPTLRLMADLSAATGGEADQMESLAYAFGKVMAMGKMTTRELRLFVSARIPIYQILREQLGLTEKDFEKLRISAAVAIPAIIRGIMKYKGASEEMERTTSGLLSSIRDYTLFITKDMLQGVFEAFRGILVRVRKFLQILRETYKTEGFAGVIKLLFPPEIRQTVVILINSFKLLGIAVAKLVRALGPVLITTLEFFARLLTYILPPLARLIESIAELAQRASRSSGVVKLLVAVISTLWIATVVAGFIGMLSKAIVGLGIAAGVSKLLHGLAVAIRAVYVAASSHPIAAIITVIAGAIVYLAMTSAWGARMLDKFQGAIARFFGIKTAIDAVTTSAEEGANAYTDYETSMEDIIKSFADLGDEAEETDDKIKKFLLSFDEVYRIPEKAGIPKKLDFEFPELPEFPEKPFGDEEYLEDVVEQTSWLADLWDRIVKALKDVKWPWTVPFKWPKFMVPELEWEPVKEWVLEKLRELAKIFEKWKVKIPMPTIDWEKLFDIDWSAVGQAISLGITSALARVGIDEVSIDIFLGRLQDSLGRAIDALPEPFAEAYTYAQGLVTSLQTAIATGDFSTIATALTNGIIGMMFKMPVIFLGAALALLWQRIINSAAVNWFKSIDWSATMEAIKQGIIKAFNAVTEWIKTQNRAPWLTSLCKALTIVLVVALVPYLLPALLQYFQSLGGRFVPAPAGAAAGAVVGGAQYGTVVNKEQLIKVGERGQKEMIAPLTERALAPFAHMIASEINRAVGGREVAPDYVLVKINRDDYVELERNLYKVRRSEIRRRGA